MSNPIVTFLFTLTGSFVIWLTKGFKGPFEKEMVSVNERHTTRGTTRYFLGMGIWLVLIVAISVIATRPIKTETKAYKGRLNEKGELVVEEIK